MLLRWPLTWSSGDITWSGDTTTFDVFYRLQVTNFDVLVLLNSAPNGPDYIDIWGLCLHVSFCFISRVSIMVCVIYRIGECALGALFEKLTVSCP
jgi:hypothetical protein